MKDSLFNIIVNKLGKIQGKIINNDTIRQLVQKTTDEEITDAKIYKLTHNLRNKGYLITIKKNYFLCTNPKKPQDEQEITQSYYRELVKKHCQTYLQGGRYIGGLKALELHLQNYEIPDTIEIVNIHKNACEIIMFQKSICYKIYGSAKSNIFAKSKKLVMSQKIGKFSFPCANIELAMLESLHSPNKTQSSLINEYIKKIIRKQKKSLNLDHFALMLSHNKHHVGINRLYQLAKSIDSDFAEKVHTLIKKYSFVMKAEK